MQTKPRALRAVSGPSRLRSIHAARVSRARSKAQKTRQCAFCAQQGCTQTISAHPHALHASKAFSQTMRVVLSAALVWQARFRTQLASRPVSAVRLASTSQTPTRQAAWIVRQERSRTRQHSRSACSAMQAGSKT